MYLSAQKIAQKIPDAVAEGRVEEVEVWRHPSAQNVAQKVSGAVAEIVEEIDVPAAQTAHHVAQKVPCVPVEAG